MLRLYGDGVAVDAQNVLDLLVAGGLAGLITALTMTWKARQDAARDDRQQRVDENAGAATAAKAITDAAGSIVKLADDQVEEFKLQIRALQAESSALSTRMDLEIQRRMRAEAQAASIEDQVNQLRERLASMGAQFELADQERVALRRENGAMKTRMFEWSVGIAALTRQVQEAGLDPAYVLEVPALDDAQRSGRLGAIDVEAVKRMQ